MGWLRRNRWGLVALLPALLALLALSAEDFYHSYYQLGPRQAIPAGADGSYLLRGTEIRLLDLRPATDLKTYGGDTFVPPPNVVIWRASISFVVKQPKPQETQPPLTGPTQSAPTQSGPAQSGSPDPVPDVTLPPETQIGGCEVTMLDAQGRTFEDDPNDLLDGVADVVAPGCFADFDAADPLRYVNSFYFALPSGAQPVEVRVSDAVSLPRYVRLTPG